MSILLYERNNLSIVAGRNDSIVIAGKCSQVDGLEEKSEQVKLIRLHISILVNGSIKNIFQQYEVNEEYKLKDYSSLNTLSDILSDLGYRVEGINLLIKKGIDKLFK